MMFSRLVKPAIRRMLSSIGWEVARKAPPTEGLNLTCSMKPLSVDPVALRALVLEYKDHPLDAMAGDVWRQSERRPDRLKDIDFASFRSDNAFVWQTRGTPLSSFVASALWAQSQDRHSLVGRVAEDGDFGAECINLNGRLWSRDVIDSILEINFLIETITDFHQLNVIVDIGAGYGRLLRRLAETTEEPLLFGADGLALSTTICRAYMDHLGLQNRVSTLSLAEVDRFNQRISLATNVHSFSEMSIEAVDWWLAWLKHHETQYLFIVPNRSGPSLNDGTSFEPLLTNHGFALVRHRRKYDDPLVDEISLYPGDYYLYARSS
jgi:putative sugar O-methyltransferase